MKCVMVMFDSLNRHCLSPYGCEWTHAPNFARLARRAVTFETSYVCSMPCMPARRDLHTGRPNFLHAPWGPLEPFDDSMPEMLSKAGVYTHLVTDHYHYWEDGGATYHNRYDSYEFFRGQEGDAWVGQVADPEVPENINGKGRRQDWVNRAHLRREADLPQCATFDAGLAFIERNAAEDGWFLQVEAFDPHEPFFSPRRYKDLYPHGYDGPLFDWPGYGPVGDTPPEAVEHLRYEYAALLSLCDARLGDVLDAFDRHGLWRDTMLVVWTDHGFLLGEHGYFAKNVMPLYEEIARTPFFVWDPRVPEAAGQRRSSLVQPAIDLAPTLLRFFGREPAPDMLGRDLAPVVADDTPVREAAVFGYHGHWVNVTDGRHVYMRAPTTPDNRPLFRYTLMPTNMRGMVEPNRLAAAELARPFSFTKGAPTLRLRSDAGPPEGGTLLWDVAADPAQASPVTDAAAEARMVGHLRRLMRACDAPPEQYERLGLNDPT
jgi:arylsulfatase A-like enzyme